MQVCIDNIDWEYSGLDSHTYQWQDFMNTLSKNCELDYLESDVWHVVDHAIFSTLMGTIFSISFSPVSCNPTIPSYLFCMNFVIRV